MAGCQVSSVHRRYTILKDKKEKVIILQTKQNY
jgi:hypothetical protein